MVLYNLTYESALVGFRVSFPRWGRAYDVDKDLFLDYYGGFSGRGVSGILELRKVGNRYMSDDESGSFNRVLELKNDIEVNSLVELCKLGSTVDFGVSYRYTGTRDFESELRLSTGDVVSLIDVFFNNGKAMVLDERDEQHLVPIRSLKSLF